MHRLRLFNRLLGALTFALMLSATATPLFALNHLIDIREVFTNEDGTIQYVELRAFEPGQTMLGPTKIVAYDDDGTETLVFNFTATFSALGDDESLLVATEGFEDEFGFEPDFIIPDGVITAGSGRVAFKQEAPCTELDCEINAVAYGDFTGDNNRFGSPGPELPSDGCTALVRSSTSNNNSLGFDTDVASPENNDGDTETAVCAIFPPLSMHIVEIYSDESGTEQFIELSTDAVNETDLAPFILVAQSADGSEETVIFDFVEEYPDLAESGGTLLLATSAIETALGVTADFAIADGAIPAGTGRIVLRHEDPCPKKVVNCEIDAVAYGDFTGDNGAFGAAAIALPADDCNGLVRIGDTDDNSADWDSATGSATNFAGDVGVVECVNAIIRGDVNANGAVNLGDAIGILTFQFLGGSIRCQEAADFNDNGALALGDPIGLLTFLFLSGVAPKPPYPDCGFSDEYELSCDDGGCP